MASVVGVDAVRSRSPEIARRAQRRPWRALPDLAPALPLMSLASLVEGEIIPRLMIAHGLGTADPRPAVRTDVVSAQDVDTFAPMTLRLDASALMIEIEALLARGVSGETILVDLLAPVARQLGTWWEEDRCDFVEVTMGLWRLQEVVRELCVLTPVPGAPGGARRVLFAAMPGDQHGFGALLVDEMFRRAGWSSDVAIDASISDLLEAAGRTWFDVIGLTVSCDCHIARLTSIILSLRSVSRNPQLRVLVGGRVFAIDPSLADVVGADGTAPDARDAVALADRLVDAATHGSVACG